ncbi:MAG TPA: hypothetical protein VJO35_12575 [Terriglobales bacterium]|nr:hypothetical protein [Terriglobales bacterium]
MADPSAREETEKKKYEAPKVTVISLRPEEAVLGHCKNASLGGPVGATCATGVGCPAIGS